MSSTAHVLSIGACILSALAPCVTAQTYSYTLQNVYAGNSFYDGFNFYSGPDPTNGFVQYVDQPTANSSGLIGFGSGGTAKWGVDDTNVISNTSSGRLSVRLESNTNYNHGLFLADIKHMPGSICGVWPAFWTLGDATWPAHGEVDIIEGVNAGTSNQVSAHTAPNCTMSYTGQTATALTTDCSLATGGATGCQSGMYEGDNNYGTPFNSNGGGVYAMQWTSAFIKVWFFPRNNIPASITAGAPNVNAFGTPNVNMDGGSCDIDSHFVNHRLIFDTTFCGDWAGAVYSSSSCPLAGTSNGCVNYVANNPTAFSEAYWEVNSIQIYQESSSASSSSSSSSMASTLSTSTSTTTSSLSSYATTTSSTFGTSSVVSSTSSTTPVVSSTSSTPSVISLTSSTPSVVSSTSTTSSVVSSTASTSNTSAKPTTTSSVPTSSAITSKSSTSTSSSVVSSTSSVLSTSTKTTSTASSPSSSTKPTSSSTSLSSSSKVVSSTTSSSSSKAVTSATSSKASASSASTLVTSTRTSTTSTKASSTTSSTPTVTATAASCPANNGQIYVSNSKRFVIECSTDHANGDLKMVYVTGGLTACIAQCATTTGCVDVTLSGTACYLKSSLGASSTSSSNGARLLTS